MSSPILAYEKMRFRWPRFDLNHFRERCAGAIVKCGLWIAPEGNASRFARRELEIAGLFDKSSDYGGMLGASTVDLIKMFSLEGHSGYSASMSTSLFEKLARFEPLTPLTGGASEWMHLGYTDRMQAQNKRCGRVFQRADGTAYDSQARVFREPSGVCFTSSESAVDITFPYTPTTEYVDVPAPSDEASE